jgi:putative transposase
LQLRDPYPKFGNWIVDVPAHHSSQECSQCHYVSPKNRDGEKFICENCGHHEDADIDAAVVIADRTRNKIGKPNLPLVKRKVTPKLESTGCKESSPASVGEPGNQARNRERIAVIVQLSLFEDVSGESPSIPLCG